MKNFSSICKLMIGIPSLSVCWVHRPVVSHAGCYHVAEENGMVSPPLFTTIRLAKVKVAKVKLSYLSKRKAINPNVICHGES